MRGTPAERVRFERAVHEVVEPLRRYLARRTDPDTAEDALAETLLALWRRRDVWPGEAAEESLPFAYGVARRCLANAHRGERRRERLAARLAVAAPPETVTTQPADADDEAALQVRDALDTLRPDDAEVLRLWAWEGLEAREVAVVLDVSANAAGVRLHRARGRLREALEQTGKSRPAAGHEQVEGGTP
ncbi:MAG: RNA polymerase [Nocardioides sp.]|nr:RNA polymerase [Nocardioides sp.]